MNQVSLNWKTYKTQFISTFSTSSNRFTVRESLLIILTGPEGNSGYGECAPLKGFSRESISNIVDFLNLKKTKIEKAIDGLSSGLEKVLGISSEFPSLQSGLEQAYFTLFPDSNQLFDSFIPCTREINGLLPLLPHIETLQKLEELIAEGYGTVKIKVGRENIKEDIDLIKESCQLFGDRISLRFDANGFWDIESAKYLFKKIDNLPIQYIEQPVKSMTEAAKLYNQFNIPVALDESAVSIKQIGDIISLNACSHIIYKPALSGGFSNFIKIRQKIQDSKIQLVITGAFESFLGFDHTVLVSAFADQNIAHGLTTQRHLENSLNSFYKISGHSIKIDKIYHQNRLNINKIVALENQL